MLRLKDFYFFLRILVFVTICSVSRAATAGTPSSHYHPSEQNVVIQEESGDGECSYILTVPKSQCSCNCREEFNNLIENYETRLREMENTVSELVAQMQLDSISFSEPSSSFQLFHSLDSSVDFSPPSMDRSPTTEFSKTTDSPTTATPTTTNKMTTKGRDFHETPQKPATTKSPATSEIPEDTEGEDHLYFNVRMTAQVDNVPLQVNDDPTINVDDLSGFVEVPVSSEEKTKPSKTPPPPIEVSKQFEEVFEDILSSPPAPNPFPSELSLAAHKSDSGGLDGVISDKYNDAQEAFNSPNQLLKPIEDVREAKSNQRENRPPPGYVDGMERAAGYAGEVNRPQWKKLESFLEGPKTNNTVKRERPTGMERAPDCRRDGCACLTSRGKTQSGIYYVPNAPLSGKRGVLVDVFCDLETKGGGWTVIQRRQNGSANFYRNWNHYAHGFGYLDDSFWIGNRMLHAMTRRFNYEIRIEFTDWDGKFGFAEHDSFFVDSEENNFRLNLGKFTAGNRGNAFSYHNGTMFSTFDRDNDRSPGECAVLRQAGFWFKNCNRMNPNGRWIPFADGTGLNGAVITWGTWSRHLFTYSLKDFRMMIRPTSSSDYA